MDDDGWLSALKTFIVETKENGTGDNTCYDGLTNSSHCADDSNFSFSIGNFSVGFQNDAATAVLIGQRFFAYMSPVIFLIGVIGNTLSLMVFLTKSMRRLSASLYLAAISSADLMALLFYVLIEWIRRGLPGSFGHVYVNVPFLERNGICHVILFLTYNFRFLSTWLLVCFTVERYIGVCHPLKRRRNISDMSSSRKLISVIVIISVLVSLFRPWLNKEVHIGPKAVPWCVRRQEHKMISFVFDCIFGISITFIPFLIITSLNILIIRKLILRNKHHRKNRIISEESIIRLEFTLILIAISLCFVAFNMPYAVIWLIHLINAWTGSSGAMDVGRLVSELQNAFLITKTIYFMNFSVNFFLYSITGAYFRRELRLLFLCQSKNSKSFYGCSVRTTSSVISKSASDTKANYV